MRVRRPKLLRARRDDQDGFVILWMVIVLVLLLSVAAFAVDLTHAYVEGDRAQKAADAATLAGATAIPQDTTCTKAMQNAVQLAADNGFDNSGLVGHEGNTVTPECTGPNEVTVNVSSRIPTFFANIIGIPALTVHRKAIAQYDPPLEMGSPANNLGDVGWDPTTPALGACADLGFTTAAGGNDDKYPCVTEGLRDNADQNLWAQIQGPDTNKRSGNAYSTTFCTTTNTDGCVNGPSGPTNNDNDGKDEVFTVHNDDPGSQLIIAVYDAGYVNTLNTTVASPHFGAWCDGRDAANAAPNAGNLNQIANADPARYFFKSPFCTGDEVQTGGCGGCPPDTTYDVKDPSGNDALCSGSGESNPLTIAGEDPSQSPTHTLSDTALKYFEKWVPICTIDPTSDVDGQSNYTVHVSSSTGAGGNQFAILALHELGQVPSVGLQVFAQERLPLFTSKPDGGQADFFVARVLPSPGHDRIMNLDLFDLGDSVVAPPTVVAGTFKLFPFNTGDLGGCQYTIPPGTPNPAPGNPEPNGAINDPTAPWGSAADLSATISDCTIPFIGSVWNGQWVTVQISVPGSYTCDTSKANNCWIKMHMDSGSTPLQDATTWNAHMAGGPVRLVG